MYSYIYPLFALQAFCIFHAYKTRQDQKWYWMIIFFPYLGCLIYLYEAFYSRQTVTSLAEGIKQVVNSNYKIEQLESAVKFSNNAKNKIDLGDAYMVVGRSSEAVTLYEECLTGYLADDSILKMKLLNALFKNGRFEDCIKLGEQLTHDKDFKDAEERIQLALAYHQTGRSESARHEFEAMDRPFTNYEHRYAYAQYLVNVGDVRTAKEKISEMQFEMEMMKGVERRTHREAIDKVEALSRQLRHTQLGR